MRGTLCIAAVALLVAGPARADDQADMRKVIDKAIKAHGGADNLGKFKALTYTTKGKFYGMSAEGIDYTGEFSHQEPDKLRQEISGSVMGTDFKFVRVVNGAKGWTQLMGQTTAMDKDAMEEAREDIYASRVMQLVALRGKGFKFAPLGEVKVGKRAAVGVKVEHKGHRDINLFFDARTGMLLKTERPIKDLMAGKEFTQTTLHDDYKEVEGVKYARKLTILRDGKKYVEGVSSDYKPQEKLDDSTFAKP